MFGGWPGGNKTEWEYIVRKNAEKLRLLLSIEAASTHTLESIPSKSHKGTNPLPPQSTSLSTSTRKHLVEKRDAPLVQSFPSINDQPIKISPTKRKRAEVNYAVDLELRQSDFREKMPKKEKRKEPIPGSIIIMKWTGDPLEYRCIVCRDSISGNLYVKSSDGSWLEEYNFDKDVDNWQLPTKAAVPMIESKTNGFVEKDKTFTPETIHSSNNNKKQAKGGEEIEDPDSFAALYKLSHSKIDKKLEALSLPTSSKTSKIEKIERLIDGIILAAIIAEREGEGVVVPEPVLMSYCDLQV